jgi:hypothetical protein
MKRSNITTLSLPWNQIGSTLPNLAQFIRLSLQKLRLEYKDKEAMPAIWRELGQKIGRRGCVQVGGVFKMGCGANPSTRIDSVKHPTEAAKLKTLYTAPTVMMQEARIKGWVEEQIVPNLTLSMTGMSNLVTEILLENYHFAEIEGESKLVGIGNGVDQLVSIVVSEADSPLHYSEIHQRVQALTDREVDIRRVQSSLSSGNLSYLFGRGIYGLERHLEIGNDSIEENLIASAFISVYAMLSQVVLLQSNSDSEVNSGEREERLAGVRRKERSDWRWGSRRLIAPRCRNVAPIPYGRPFLKARQYLIWWAFLRRHTEPGMEKPELQ